VDIDSRVHDLYQVYDESARLHKPGLGTLTRLRTWDIFERYLPATGRIADVGGGPGVHAAHLAARGFEVVLLDPVERHVAEAGARSAVQLDAPFESRQAEARSLPLADDSVDVVLLMGPLYHLVDRPDRLAALREAVRVLRPGGRIVAEVITRYAWVVDATAKGLLGDPETWDDFAWNIGTGLSKDPDRHAEGTFWAYFHRPAELAEELTEAGFGEAELVAVEGFAGLLGDLPQRMAAAPDDLIRVVRLTEQEPTMLGVSGHVLGVASLPA
jgi:SAM-dependent methyltransferase